jgi:hypothetical protein
VGWVIGVFLACLNYVSKLARGFARFGMGIPVKPEKKAACSLRANLSVSNVVFAMDSPQSLSG